MDQSQDISIEFTDVPRFAVGDAGAVGYLEDQGFVVIAQALSTEQSEQALALLWDYLEGLGTGISRDDIGTWGDDRWPTAVHGAILPSYGIGHCAAQWFIRDVPAVQHSFAQVWETEDLLVSFDGVSLWRPWQHNPAWRTNEGPSWLHIDQHPIGRPGKHCVQGLVNLLPSSPAIGGNVLIPGSHKRFANIPVDYPERLARIHPSIDHFRFPKNDPLLADTQPIMPNLHPGDLLLWDSRTIHCSAPGQGDAPNIDGLLRAASLVCMMPKEKSNPKVIERRKQAVAKLTSTTNWSDVFVDADQFPEVLAAPNREAYRWPEVPKLNHSQLRMVGWDPAELA